MVLLPQGQSVYENLNTSFTQFDALMTELQTSQFTGYVRVTAWEYAGWVLMDNGHSISALEETTSGRQVGVNAADAITAKAKEKDGAIHVVRLESAQVALLGALMQGDLVYQDLASEFTRLDKLVAKLKEERHSGYLQVRFEASPDQATVYFQEGEPVECVIFDEGAFASGATLLNLIVEMASQRKALFNVYRVDLAQAYGARGNLAESFARQSTLNLWQHVLSQIEHVVDPNGKTDLFRTALKRACIEQADDFTFLDPFVGEFEYRAGQITFTGAAPVSEFNRGLSLALAAALQKLVAQAGRADLIATLASALTDLKKQSGERLEEVGLVAAIPNLFGT